MKNKIFPFILITILIGTGCFNKSNNLKKKLDGTWLEVAKILNPKPNSPLPPDLNKNRAIKFAGDKIEFFEGVLRHIKNADYGKSRFKYYGTIFDYKISNDSIFVKFPPPGKWKFYWKIEKILKDTLYLRVNQSLSLKLVRQNYDLKSKQDFDQIILSSSGCFGSCPILAVSIDKNNNFNFLGNAYVDSYGFFEAKISDSLKEMIFNKFEKINIKELENDYFAAWTDDETICTTFIKDGKIIKTIRDYGRVAKKELVWAYVPLRYLYALLKLDTISNDVPFSLLLEFASFDTPDKRLGLKKSEGFFLWTELRKSVLTDKKFDPIYSMKFYSENYFIWNKEEMEKITSRFKVNKIETDGRYYKFYLENSTLIYDLGYNFVNRNFSGQDFSEKVDFPF